MFACKFGFSGAALLFLLVGSPAARPTDKVVSYELRAVTSRGAAFTGLVPRTEAFDLLLDGGDSIDPASIAPAQRLKLSGVNGLSGTVTFYYGGLTSIQVVARLTEQDLKQLRKARVASQRSRLEREQVRLRQIKSRRETAQLAGLQEQREEQEQRQAGKPMLSAEHQQWIDRFPPDKGWIPAKKARLYYQTVILNNRTPTDDERAWLDAYDQWKPAYDAWLKLEQEKLAESEAAKQDGQGVEQPTGNDRSDPSGTSASPGAGIDPGAPTPEEQQQLPPALDPDTKKPEKISEKAPKPVPLKPYAIKPDPLKDGSRPRRS